MRTFAHLGRKITLIAILLLAGSVVLAQNDGAYVIKKSLENHFLAHVNEGGNWVLRDATSFSPDCLWYSGRDFNVSGTNHNYYFFDETGTPHYLGAPFQAGGAIYLTTTPPETYLLSNPDMDFYFYDWDSDAIGGRGVARGHQYAGITDPLDCEHDWDTGAQECWEVYWVGYTAATGWKLTTASSYDLPEDTAARYRSVQITLHPVQVSNPSGGLIGLSNPASMTYQGTATISGKPTTPQSYNHTFIPAYGEYVFEGNTHFYYNNQEQSSAPGTQTDTQNMDSCRWTITGPGAEFLTLSNPTSYSTTLSYSHENTTGHKTATLTLTVYYPSGATQTKTADVQVLMECGNPTQAAAPVVSDLGVTVSWVASADEYRVEWRKQGENYGAPVEVGSATSFTITGLEYNANYEYRVTGKCGSGWEQAPDNPTGTFTTKKEPNLVVYGAIFGGGRMADVTGKTEVVVINADSIGAIYGGNDIAGEVKHADGSTITLGVNSSDPTYASYGITPSNGKVRVGSVYGGGNGYYIYDGNLPSPAIGDTILPTGQFTDSVTELSGGPSYMASGTIPKIIKTTITMNNDAVKVDSIFGGAKNAFLSASSGNSTSITLNGGTAFAVFGGNNFGGVSGTGTSKHAIVVDSTKVETTVADYNSKETGRDFGVRYLFGGGNKVAALESDILISGGQCDTVFAGGNSADVATAQVVVNCPVASGSGVTFGSTYSNAIASATSSSVTVKDNTAYPWNGTGIYNVRTLFGGNNRANMKGLPTVTLTSGSVGTVYGGGNAGNMLAKVADAGGTVGIIADDFGSPQYNGNQPIYYGTHVVMDHATMLVDYLYGGCQMSDVDYSTWVEIEGGHVGTVYGGCNISGDVGSIPRIGWYSGMPSKGEEYQIVHGGTYVKASGGTVHGNLFAGSNGFYHCNNGVEYVSGLNFGTPPYDPEERYVGMVIPTHNETHVMVSGTATVDGNVYAGGNMAYVGFIPSTDQGYRFRDFVGMASVRMNGGTVEGDVYGGGNRASVFGSNEVKVSGGTINGALYGGNDRAGQVAQISNRILSGEYATASDGITNLKTLGVNTYVSVTGRPDINTVYGGGNGAYTYTPEEYCDVTDQPVQSNTFVDINLDGYPDGAGGHIATVYGGGNGVTVTGGITVLLNVKGEGSNPPLAYDHVDNLFGGNNQGPLAILPDIILMSGQANTVYGGCNAGAMTGSHTLVGADGESYTNVGSRVHLRPTYTPVGTATTVNLLGTVSHAVYGGCRMNGVDNNSIVLVDGGTYAASLFGGSDISGDVLGTSQVVVKSGTVGNVYGGGNGNYDYSSGDYAGMTAPTCATSRVDILGGQVGASGTNALGESNARNIFGGGLGHDTQTTGDVTVNIGSTTGSPTIYGDIYGGSALGIVNSSSNDVTTVNILNGNITGDVYGGGLGHYEKGVDSIAAVSYGKTYVNIGADNNGNYTGNVTFNNGRVFGCNNEYGTPLDSVFVNIYKTAHGADAAHNLYPSEPSGGWSVSELSTNAGSQTYAIDAVYGGGNLAAYTPTVANRGSIVHVYGCDNTVHSVFGGGNAADVGTGDVSTLSVTTRANTNVIVEGGRFHRVIGGGNGEVAALPAANIFGTANTTVYAGLIDEIYGGANIKGSVDDINLLISNPDNLAYNGCTNYTDEVYGMVFGCANAAPYNKSVTTTIECGVGAIGALYGGSNQNYIGNPDNHNSGVSVTLNLYGGEYVDVFAGSKGVAADPANNITGVAANIYGDVNLNLYGGKITNAFGGCDANGNVTGVITVNVLDHEGTCALDVENIYGASNLTAYTPDNPSTIVSPVVNVIHIKNEQSGVTYGIRGNVFGGGNLAEVTSNPKVNIGYYSDMNIPTGYPIAEANRVAKVTGNVFGGGNQAGVNGNDTVIIRRANSYANNLFGGGNEAGVTGNPVVIVEDGTVNTGVYGGCNTNGTVTGDIEVNILGGTLGTSSTAMPSGIFGGGFGENTETSGNITVNIGDASHEPEIYADIYGGSALGDVHTLNTTTDVTTVNFAKGTLHGNLYGGGLGQASPAISAEVNGSVVVNIGKDKTGSTIDGGLIYGSVFGANNINGSPKGSVTVNVYSAVTDSIFGGGNQSAYVPTTASIAYPEVNVIGGEVKYKVVGGGNAAGVTANPTINISGGQVCTDNSTRKAGVYGGCNTSGTVTGDITINITGSTTNTTTIGTMTDLEGHNPVSVHGGGYGQGTSTVGNITVNFGAADEVTTPHCEYPMLYGDLYGGSALGEVNSSSASPVNTTTINILNGSFKYYEYAQGNRYYQEGGNIYGGGLGDKASLGTGHSDVAAKVWGEVHVNIGAPRENAASLPFGQASLVHCNVYGCNNTNGSPQQNVYVDVYQTHHTSTDEASYMGGDRTYAIANVLGGGNQANFHPDVNTGWTKKTNVSVHYCDNTSENVYGGGNAADTDGTVVWVEGGRFNNIFGGGNGQVSVANIGQGSTDMTLLGGHVAYYFQGCNMHGEVGGTQHLQEGCPTGETCECDALVIENHYFGANQATVYNGINETVNCGQTFTFRKVYAGSRLATIYGDIRLTIRGGEIQYLFGGCEGSADISADVKKYPSLAWAQANDIELYNYMMAHGESALEGKGGNIILTLEGGDIGTVFGGCDYRGIVEGTIQIIVDSTQTGTCGLDIDYIYGGNNLAAYTAPANAISPLVELRNGHVNFDVFGGSLGGNPSHLYGNGLLTGNPKVIIGDTAAGQKFYVGRDIFGGGSAGKVIGDTDVILQGKTTIGGNVFGGGKQADVEGSTNVTIVPNNP